MQIHENRCMLGINKSNKSVKLNVNDYHLIIFAKNTIDLGKYI